MARTQQLLLVGVLGTLTLLLGLLGWRAWQHSAAPAPSYSTYPGPTFAVPVVPTLLAEGVLDQPMITDQQVEGLMASNRSDLDVIRALDGARAGRRGLGAETTVAVIRDALAGAPGGRATVREVEIKRLSTEGATVEATLRFGEGAQQVDAAVQFLYSWSEQQGYQLDSMQLIGLPTSPGSSSRPGGALDF